MVIKTLANNKSGVSQAIDSVKFAVKKVPTIEKFRIKLAETNVEKKAAYKLAYDAYQKKGYVDENSKDLLVEEYDEWKGNAICIAVDHIGEVVGTATVLCGNKNKLPCSELFNINEYSSYYQTAELVRLAISEQCTYGLKVLQEMYVFLYLHSKGNFNTSYFLIEVNPRHVKFYEARLGFTKLHEGLPCPRVKGAPAVLLGSDFSIFTADKISRNLSKILSKYESSVLFLSE